ncbi:MAG: glycosyltransferase [Candidatus Firestonebacteria bacterium]
MKVSVIILTHKPDECLDETLSILTEDKNIEIIVINSSGQVLRKHDIKIIMIQPDEFNHGKTRNLGWKESNGDIVVFLTQDSMLTKDAIENIIKVFDDPSVGVATGRQLPRKDATPFAAHARLFNYPEISSIKTFDDKNKYGIKTFFNSNSFAAYRRKVLEEIGGFPENIIASEDNYLAAKALMNGYKISYVAQACVYHSHNYKPMQEFKRYFDIGVFHLREKWLMETFGKAEGEGKKFVMSEFNYLIKNGYWYLIPISIYRNALKYIAYRLGKVEKIIPLKIKAKLSMQKEYWK